MILRSASVALAFGLMASPVLALTLSFPAPVTQTADEQAKGGVRLPRAAFRDGDVAVRRVSGTVSRQAWRLAAGTLTTDQILAPLKMQLQQDGFTVLFECRDRACGGYDFRFAADVLGEPAMHVDLGDYRYVLAEDETGVTVALMVSRSPQNGFVQLTLGGQIADLPELAVTTSTKSSDFSGAILTDPDLGDLAATGRVALDDLLFQTGSSELEHGDFPSLQAVAGFLTDNPDRTITLVGHTDTQGALQGNIALSKRRAQAVRDVLIRDFGIARGRLDAEGVGYLAPRATNATDDGRRANRRVEVVLNN
ncbi:OmpA family protein [Oceaniglobus ichthyenteri]|uniref:OmpA family protein n=1 Tax=Oceaniglobus ichthyenteri TaxID=2136177 RepID=UPI000D37C335|nr:OmpA family protein [Oceaniglobus ichthyenteri]